mmetsp:Transcript_40435/g.84482  ORF Transcript_40435/g.84482 Transcript_40435/m.84482 type:complete len:86 (+) Transcript_40435:5087-5344(+)
MSTKMWPKSLNKTPLGPLISIFLDDSLIFIPLGKSMVLVDNIDFIICYFYKQLPYTTIKGIEKIKKLYRLQGIVTFELVTFSMLN